jgi:hypothetical protein
MPDFSSAICLRRAWGLSRSWWRPCGWIPNPNFRRTHGRLMSQTERSLWALCLGHEEERLAVGDIGERCHAEAMRLMSGNIAKERPIPGADPQLNCGSTYRINGTRMQLHLGWVLPRH